MTDLTSARDWCTAIPQLECPDCTHELKYWPSLGLICRQCGCELPIQDQLCVVQQDYAGNNNVAAEFYDSSRWDKYRFWKRFTPFNDRAATLWSEEVFAKLPSLAGKRVLDIAIGDGRNMSFIPQDCEVYGVDVSAAQLKSCNAAYPDRNLWLFQGEAESLPFKAGTFDCVLSFGAFNYFNDPKAALEEMSRVVKPSGQIIVTDEYADIPKRMIGHRIGLPILDRFILRRFLHLGKDFADMVQQHSDLKIEPIVEDVLDDCQFSEVCNGWAYCFAGSPRAARGRRSA